MAAVPTPSQLARIDDEELERLAVTWRTRAGYGERDAFGIAHALEVERRRRQRETQLNQLPPEPAPIRPWWKFWQSGSGADPMATS